MTPRRLRSELIEPPDPPDGVMMDRLTAAFRKNPRIAEAWLRGQRVIPEGMAAWEETDIVLVLDPPLPSPAESPRETRDQIVAIDQSLESTGWVRKGDERRSWIYAPHDGRSDRSGSRIYERDHTAS